LSRRDTYSSYNNFNLKSFISLNGDSYDRFLLRMFEMSESLNIINQCINFFNKTSNNIKNKLCIKEKLYNFNSILFNTLKTKYNSNTYVYMEDLIEHFCS
jgi:NADH:ubiquinone oxidoreductase subunit D